MQKRPVRLKKDNPCAMGCVGLLTMVLSQYYMAMAAMAMTGSRASAAAVYVVRVKGSPLSAFRGSPDLPFASTAHVAPGSDRPDFSRSVCLIDQPSV